ncbi:hypothetical protein Taro_052504 [Colocasia esculenta]|uniref:Uncharacterized protein n=1 Tax=Colocasia esculenta TaxID=4460 RepID=A0A843XIT5_COLES|nr:hypothetical protein [Colocasia esculenta]
MLMMSRTTEIVHDARVDQEQWKKAIQTWTLTDWKFKTNGSTLNRGDLFLKTRVKKNGLPVNEDTATVIISMLGRKVKLCDMYRRPIAGGIVMAEEMSKIVMGKKLGEEYLEISVLIAFTWKKRLNLK